MSILSSIITGPGTSVTSLDPAGTLTPAAIVAVNQGGVDVQTTAQKLATLVLPTVQLSADTILASAAHHNRKLVCTTALTLSLPATPSALGDGFSCVVLNLSGAAVTLGAGITSTTGVGSIGTTQRVPLDGTLIGGTYTLLASLPSAGGSVSAPGQVTGLTIGTVTGISAALSWTAPASGGLPTAYTVEYSSNSGSTWVVSSASVGGSPYTVTSLTNSTAYQFRVTATNSGGAGTSSATASTTTAPPVAGPVNALTLGAVTSTTIAVSYTAPTTGGAVVSYSGKISTDTGVTYVTNAGAFNATGGTFTGLTAATPYKLEILATNGSGSSITVLSSAVSTLAGGSNTTYLASLPALAGGSPIVAYDASLLTDTVGSKISALLDQTGNGVTLSQAVSAKQPIVTTVNGKKALSFLPNSSAPVVLLSASVAGTIAAIGARTQMTMMAVAKVRRGATRGPVAFIGDDNANGVVLFSNYFGGGDAQGLGWHAGPNISTPTVVVPTGTVSHMALAYNGSTYMKININGSTVISGAGGDVNGGDVYNRIGIGFWTGSGAYDATDYDLCEMIMWPGLASDAELTSLMTYCTNKWGV